MKIAIVPYSPQWPEDFRREKARIRQALAAFESLRVEHIGSTSVPGLAAKPIIDILVGVAGEEMLAASVAPMQAAGFAYFKKYEDGMPYRRLFVKLHSPEGRPTPTLVDVGDDIVTGRDLLSLANIHLLVYGTPHWHRHIAFRDYLRAHPEVRQAYEDVKKEISRRDFHDTLEYNAAKNDFVKRVEAEALAWYGQE